MRKNFGAKTILYPMPVFVIGTYDKDGIPNAMNAAWGGISETSQISICVDSSHKTAKNLVQREAFTVSIANEENIAAADFVGIVSGNEVSNKLQKAGWTATKSEFVDAPIFEELPMTLECRVISYDEETCRLVGEIINVSADEKILDADGKISIESFHPVIFDPIDNVYRKIGESVADAFSVGLKLKSEE